MLPARCPGILDSTWQAEAHSDGPSQWAPNPAPAPLQFQVRLKTIPLSFKNFLTR